MMIFRRRLLLLTAFSVGSFLSMIVQAQVQVSASIRPLQMIVAAITDGVTEPALILEANQDPHQSALRPSQRRAIAQADLILWVGPGMESSLSKVIIPEAGNVMTALNLEGIQKQPLRNGVDPHLWLNTENARVIARALSQALGSLDTVNSLQYHNNLLSFEEELMALDKEIQADVSQYADQAFAVYHNAFQYYEQQFGLQHVASFTDDEEIRPGIRRLLSIKAELQENEVNCLLVEPSTNIEELSNIISRPSMRFVSIDVLGLDFPIEKSAYRNFMLSLTGAITECLR
jgi:zinc transport system substrate-binding protein